MKKLFAIGLALTLELVAASAPMSARPDLVRAKAIPGYWVPLPAATIVFPKETIGDYFLQRSFRGSVDYAASGFAKGKAAGVLHKPAGVVLRLEPFYDRSDKLKKLETLKPNDIQALDLRNDELVTDEDLKHVGKLTGLVEIDLTDTDIGDKGVHELTAIKNLHTITIRNTDLTNNGVKELLKLPNLKELCMAANHKIDDSGAAYVAQMKGLIGLDIGYTNIRNKGVDQIITSLPQLRTFASDGVRFSDNAFKHIDGISKLQKLSIVNAKITDASIPLMKKLKELVSLDMRGTGITPRGLQELRRALPVCEIKAGDADVPFFRQ